MLTPSRNNIPVADDDDVTIVASNLTSDVRGWDDATATTAPSTDESDTETFDGAQYRVPTTIPHMILPWGGREENKTASKHKRRVERRELRRAITESERVQQRERRESRKYKSRNQIWKAMMAASNLNLPETDGMDSTKLITRMVDIEYGLSDSGASAHFLVEGAPVVNMKEATRPIAIKFPNGKIIYSIHT